ncbi:unnamed protein product [Urochloa humidicola]
MDSTAAEDETRPAKRARLTTPSAAGDDADLISGLDDDVLLRILALVQWCPTRRARARSRGGGAASGHASPRSASPPLGRRPAPPNRAPPWNDTFPSSTTSLPGVCNLTAPSRAWRSLIPRTLRTA